MGSSTGGHTQLAVLARSGAVDDPLSGRATRECRQLLRRHDVVNGRTRSRRRYGLAPDTARRHDEGGNEGQLARRGIIYICEKSADRQAGWVVSKWDCTPAGAPRWGFSPGASAMHAEWIPAARAQ
jgi:hypothetical protein